MATEKAKKAIGWFLAVSFIAIASLLIISYFKTNAELPLENVLYYGEDCPHCKNVEAFMSENNATSKISITQKEVWYNQTNKAEFMSVVEYCGINPSKAGVPLFYTGGDEDKACFAGDKDIINLLKAKLNITG